VHTGASIAATHPSARRSALQNAASIASLLLTTEAVICEIPEAKSEKGSAGMSPGGDMY
jgi:chaperonin GroEL